MSRWRNYSNRSFALFLVFALSGCYSGWNRPKGGSDPDPNKPTPPMKKLGLVIVDEIAMTGEALSDRNCSIVPVSLVDLRMTEQALRRKLLYEALQQVAEVLNFRSVFVDPKDCRSLTAIERDAADGNLSGVLDGVSREIRMKPAVHIKFVYWLGDQSSYEPSEAVTSTDWAVMRTFENSGFERRLSVSQFVLMPRYYSGYVGAWSARSWSSTAFYPPTVDNLTPDQEGLNSLVLSAQTGTRSFIAWLLERAAER